MSEKLLMLMPFYSPDPPDSLSQKQSGRVESNLKQNKTKLKGEREYLKGLTLYLPLIGKST